MWCEIKTTDPRILSHLTLTFIIFTVFPVLLCFSTSFIAFFISLFGSLPAFSFSFSSLHFCSALCIFFFSFLARFLSVFDFSVSPLTSPLDFSCKGKRFQKVLYWYFEKSCSGKVRNVSQSTNIHLLLQHQKHPASQLKYLKIIHSHL